MPLFFLFYVSLPGGRPLAFKRPKRKGAPPFLGALPEGASSPIRRMPTASAVGPVFSLIPITYYLLPNFNFPLLA